MKTFETSTQEDRLDFSNINRIRKLRNSINLANVEINEIATPYTCDMESLISVYRIFKSIVGEQSETTSYGRKKFLMAVMDLSPPMPLAGGKMRSGLRQKLADVMNIKTHTTISANLQDVMILYRNYRDFRRDVNMIIKNYLKNNDKTCEI